MDISYEAVKDYDSYINGKESRLHLGHNLEAALDHAGLGEGCIWATSTFSAGERPFISTQEFHADDLKHKRIPQVREYIETVLFDAVPR